MATTVFALFLMTGGVAAEYMVYTCDRGELLRVRFLESAVDLQRGTWRVRLPQAISASGARYSDGNAEFWEKGGLATFNVANGPKSECRLTGRG